MKFGDPFNGEFGQTLRNYWSNLESINAREHWIELIPKANVERAVSALNGQATILGDCFYPLPEVADIEELTQQINESIPPVGKQTFLVKSKPMRPIDFRTILFAGWVATNQRRDVDFYTINRLCDHAIMQQQAIKRHLEYKSKARAQ